MSVAETAGELERTLRERFGMEHFRTGQREVIEHVLGGRDVLCVMPTGGGKSLCYQLPALLLPGITLVISPLIALMKDQVDALHERGIGATLINSTLDPTEIQARLSDVERGHHHLVYVAPERFRSPRFVALMGRIRPSLLAIDEAHCISQWGHDFRPDYSRLGQARRQLGSPPCIALTATATDVVRRDIADQLDLKDPALFVTGFDRPNLRYAVVAAAREGDKLERLAKALDRNRGPAVVYASSRARCESIASFLRVELRREVVVYHAGLERSQRTEAQDKFMSGEAEVVVATNAFGMGVDKPDIRAVVHFNMPGTLEAYYQEAGRAGRDGMPSECLLLYAPSDRILQEHFIESEYPPPNAVFEVYEFLRRLDSDPIELTHAEIRESARLDLNESAVGTVLKILDGAGAIEKFLPRENMAIVRFNAEADGPTSFIDRLGPQAHQQRTVLLGLEGLVRGRWGEPVYFRPNEVATALGLEQSAFSRALKALVSTLPVDYIPPFRGNAIKVIDRQKKPRDLKIDFKALDARKRREYDKLERMINYAQTTRCRRAYILGYFGDAGGGTSNCGSCDRCRPHDGMSGRTGVTIAIDTPEGREVLLKILSGVARTKGRFGKVLVAQMLTGSDSERMNRWNLDRLSTYGILRDSGFAQKEVSDILDALTRAGLVEAQDVDRFKPVITLTEAGWKWLRDQEPPALVLDLPEELLRRLRTGGNRRSTSKTSTPTRTKTSSGEPGENAPSSGAIASSRQVEDEPDSGQEPSDDLVADPLRDRLRQLRGDWARQLQQPAYCIFTNQTLEDLVRLRPTTPAALTAIKGLGRSRVERFGETLLDAIRSIPECESGPQAPSEVQVQPPPPSRSRLVTEPEFPAKADQAMPPVTVMNAIGRSVVPTRVPEQYTAPGTQHPPTPSPEAAPYVSTEEWSWRLLEKGFTIEEAAAIRGVDKAAIVRHLTWMVRRGHRLAIERFLPPDVAAEWSTWMSERGDTPGPKEPEGLLITWPLFLACRNRSSHD